MASNFHRWELLPELGKACYNAGCTLTEIRSTVRHLIITSGYTTCLATTNNLYAAELLEENTPAKAGGAPGNAFELVYTKITDTVRKKVHTADPVLGEYIRTHLYGDIYSSPGITLAQRQLFMMAFLAEAHMHEELFGHAYAGFRFGNDKEAALKVVDMGFELSPAPSNNTYKSAIDTMSLAYKKFKKDFPNGPPPLPEVSIPDPESVRIPPLPPSYTPDPSSKS
ncbi:hypothetical protein WJX74_005436 [Apatococcus lobatus]|uniref:Carboxymuconolactone decarboxylase-like domain-containing protein n=2 Tax=Apatococcus TaxID=904362 RepID=A0AAW1SGX3_9CHLO